MDNILWFVVDSIYLRIFLEKYWVNFNFWKMSFRGLFIFDNCEDVGIERNFMYCYIF